MKHKGLKGLKITDADEGLVKAVFATLNVVDSDGDVTLPGAFGDQKVRISAYNHASWSDALPVGKGTIHEDGDEAIFEGEFFLDTAAGRDTFAVVKGLADLGEWSYGYDVTDAEQGTKDGAQVQFLKSLKVHEVSPVILGAGVDTRTLAVKAKELQSTVFRRLRDAALERWGGDGIYVYADDIDIDESWAVFAICPEDDPERVVRVSFTRAADGSIELGDEETEVERTTDYTPKAREGRKLSEHIASVLADVKALNDRVADVMAKRAEKGKSLGGESADLLAELEPSLQRLKGLLVPEPDEAVTREYLRAQRNRAHA